MAQQKDNRRSHKLQQGKFKLDAEENKIMGVVKHWQAFSRETTEY